MSSCPACGHIIAPHYSRCPRCEGNRNRETSDRLVDAIRSVKANPPRTAEAQRESIKQLVELGHPFAGDLVRIVADKKP